MKRTITLIPWLLGLGGFFLSVSCSEDPGVGNEMEEYGMPANWRFTLPQGDPAEGRKIFVELECYKCHKVKGETFPAMAESEKGIGPDLSQMAGMHPPEFFAESIVNPNAVIDAEDKEKGYLGDDGRSKMPDYNDLLTAKQVTDLASYLASLNKEKQTGR